MRQATLTERSGGDAGARMQFGPLIMLAAHLCGVVAVAIALGSFLLPGAYVDILMSAGAKDQALGQSLIRNGVVHVVLSALIWTVFAVVFQSLWRRRHRLKRRQRATQRTRGSVYLEFLAVFPVFILLTFGLLQLAFINIGGALARVAAYEAARAAWIWEPEMSVGQIDPSDNITLEDVEDRIRIAAALVMTPVAPGDYAMDGDVTPEFEAMRIAMTARFTLVPELAEINSQMADAQMLGGDNQASLERALDSAAMPERAYRKFTFSYLATDLEGNDNGLISEPNRVGARFIYSQHMAMPFVNIFLGQENPGLGGRGGHYFEWDVEYTFPRQRHGANREVP